MNSYTLSIDTPLSQASADGYENNNTRATASEIRDLTTTLSNLNLHNATDEDWFKFTTTSNATTAHQVFVEYDPGAGDLLLSLYDASESLLSETNTVGTGVESLSLNGFNAGTYYAKVNSPEGSTIPTYNFSLNAPESPSSESDEWTILVYVAADNNLEQFAIRDLNEMEAVDLPDNINVVVQVDRINGYDTTNGDWTDTRRGLIQHDNNRSTLATNFESLGELDMGNPQTLTDFINWGSSTYTAENYAVVVWDHGGGFYGVAWDDTNDSSNLSLSEVQTAITNASLGDSLGLVGFDACLMALAEVADDLSPLADVMVAAQQIEPGDGWNYEGFLNALADYPSMSAQDLGSAIVDSYGEYYFNQWTLSAVDLAQYDNLQNALNSFADTVVASATSADWAAISNARDSATVHDSSFVNDRDLGSFMSSVAANATTQSIRDAATTVSTVLAETIINKVGSSDYSGLGLYLPSAGSSVSASYDFTSSWEDFVTSLADQSRSSSIRLVQDNFESTDRSGNSVNSGNDTRSTATNLGVLAVSATYANLSIDSATDVDWFRFDVEANINPTISIDFAHDQGDLQIELFDSSGTLITSSNTSDAANGTESITSALNAAGGRYFLKVASVGGVTQRDYDLTLSVPVTRSNGVPEDDYENNDSLTKASNIGSLGQNSVRTLTGLTLEDVADGGDWFVFNPSRLTDLNPNVVTVSGYTGNVDLKVYASDGFTLLGSSDSLTGSTESVSFGSTNSEVYVHVTSPDELLGTEYTLSFARRNFDLDGTGSLSDADYNLISLYRALGSQPSTMDLFLDLYPSVFQQAGATRSSASDLTEYLGGFVDTVFDVDQNNVVNDFDYNLISLYRALGSQPSTLDLFLSLYPDVFKDPTATLTTANQIINQIDTFA